MEGRHTHANRMDDVSTGGSQDRVVEELSTARPSIPKEREQNAKEATKPKIKDTKEGQNSMDGFYAKTMSILNMLSPQTFQTVVSQMKALPIDSERKLKGIVDLVLEKAISEPNLSATYANLCRCLSMIKVASDSKPGNMINFKAVLLTRCQREFEKNQSSGHKQKRTDISISTADLKRDDFEQELECDESLTKRRSLGNIRFIGELFKKKMLTENIMHDCVFKLLRSKDSDNLECVCLLFTTIGQELDVERAKPRMNQYFQQMQKIVNEKKTLSRVRCLLQDVIDLRLNEWVPRDLEKTIDKEDDQKADEKALLDEQTHPQQKSRTGGDQAEESDEDRVGAEKKDEEVSKEEEG